MTDVIGTPVVAPVATKYITLADLKAYFTSNHIIGATDDNFMYQAITRAEGQVDEYCGCSIDRGVQTLVLPSTAFVDKDGWMWLWAKEKGPVTDVSAIKFRYPAGQGWKDAYWVPTDDIILPPVGAPPSPEAWRVRVAFTPRIGPVPASNIMVKWSYAGGYGTLGGSPDIPSVLKAIVCRLAHWNYMMRDAPTGKVITAELGLMTIPLSIPPDIEADLNFWKRTES